MNKEQTAELDPATERLAAELADVEASIALVSSGVATRVTLTGMRFGLVLTEHFHDLAAREGVGIEATFWPEDSSDIHISKVTNV